MATLMTARERLRHATDALGTTVLAGARSDTLIGPWGRIVVRYTGRDAIFRITIQRPGDIARSLGGGKEQFEKLITTINR